MPPPESRGFKSGGSKPMTRVILSVAEIMLSDGGVAVGATAAVVGVGPVGAWTAVGAAVGGTGVDVAAALQARADTPTRTPTPQTQAFLRFRILINSSISGKVSALGRASQTITQLYSGNLQREQDYEADMEEHSPAFRLR
jgi:hypothetical protein